MRRYRIEFKTVTPLLMSGADQNEFELREMSIAGAMRYWYRKLYGNKNEKEIFGSTDQKGRFKIAVRDLVSEHSKLRDYKKLLNNDGNYFLGVLRGMDSKGILPENANFSLEILVSSGYHKEVLGSLWASVYIGGWGMRSRRGFGSVKVLKMEHDESCEDFSKLFYEPFDLKNIWESFGFRKNSVEFYIGERFDSKSYKDISKKLLKEKGFHHHPGKFRNFVERSKSQSISCPCRKAAECLDLIGWTLMYFRSYLEPDYSKAKSAANSSVRLKPSELFRSAFGLPIIFYFSSIASKTGVVGRSPSRLIIRVYEAEGFYYPVLILDKSRKFDHKVDLVSIYLKSMEESGFKKVIV